MGHAPAVAQAHLDGGQEDEVIVALGHLRVQVGREETRRLARRRRRPAVRIRGVEDLLPVCEPRHDLEGLGELARAVRGEELADGGVHLDDFWRQLGNRLLVLRIAGTLATLGECRAAFVDLVHDHVGERAGGRTAAHEEVERALIILTKLELLYVLIVLARASQLSLFVIVDACRRTDGVVVVIIWKLVERMAAARRGSTTDV